MLRITENPTLNETESTPYNPKYSWWIANTFEPPVNSGIEPSQFNQVEGYEITEFMNTNRASVSEQSFIKDLSKKITELPVTVMKFSEQTIWKLYVSAKQNQG